MGFKAARNALVEALKKDDYQHESRDVMAEKNLLAVGEVTEDDVVRMIRRTRGDQDSSSPHDWDSDTVVHLFRPEWEGVRWYVKVYFLTPPSGSAVFISVHK